MFVCVKGMVHNEAEGCDFVRDGWSMPPDLAWWTTPLVQAWAGLLMNVHKTPSLATSCKEDKIWYSIVGPCLISGAAPPS